MNCKEFIDFMGAYLDDDLPRPQREAFEQKLAECDYCRHFLETYRQAVAVGKKCHNCEEDGQTLNDQVPEDLIQAILHARTRAE